MKKTSAKRYKAIAPAKKLLLHAPNSSCLQKTVNNIPQIDRLPETYKNESDIKKYLL